jgi:hypothetical protein
MRLNPFPIVLAMLHRAGLDWEPAGEAWSLLMSSLVVLPLFGWLRRQFDDRVALAGCFLYAVHSEFIRWSPEVIRDPTFWFLFTLSLYLLWRAVTEVRIWLFVATGMAMTAATLTRFEGLLLLAPLGLWSLWRWRALHECRGRLIAGMLCCVGILPALAGLGWAIWLRGHSLAEMAPLRSLQLAQGWAHTLVAPLWGDTSGDSPLLPRSLGPISLGRMLEIYVPTVLKGMMPAFGVLLAIGIATSWRLWKRRDNVALLVAQAVLLLAMWVHLWASHTSCKRYVLPLVIMSSGFTAMGLLKLSAFAARLVSPLPRAAAARLGEGQGVRAGRPSNVDLPNLFTRSPHPNPLPKGEGTVNGGFPASRLRPLFGAAPAAIVAAISLALVLGHDFSARAEQVELGRWIRSQTEQSPMLFGPDGFTQVVNFYAEGQCLSFLPEAGEEVVADLIQKHRPDIIVLPQDCVDFRPQGALVRRMETAGFRQVRRDRVPKSCGSVLVMCQAGMMKDEGCLACDR